MNIYAIRDRLLDYFMQPFAAPHDKDVMGAISNQINQGDPNAAIAAAPHHFEIWRLGLVKESGDIAPGKELICDCSSLVRTSLRQRASERPGDYPPEGTHPGKPHAPGRPTSRHAAFNGALPNQAPPAPGQGEEAPPGSQRGTGVAD